LETYKSKITNRPDVSRTGNGRTGENTRRARKKIKTNEIRKEGNLRERPATENLAEMFVELEPVWEDPEEEQEDGKTEQHHSRHDADCVPNLSSGRCHEAMEGQAVKKQTLSECHT